MRIRRRIVVLDAADIASVSSFWARLLGGTVDDSEHDWHNVVVDGVWTLGIQLAPDHAPPEWPSGTQQQVHLDLWVDDLAAARDHALSVGARLLQPPADPTAEEQFIVFADPAGHPFCLCWHAEDTG